MTCTDDTTSTGRLMAGLPVTGSVTFALLTNAPLCVLRVPLRLTCPSGPRTTPGMSGREPSKRSLTLGASRNVLSEMVSLGAGLLLRLIRGDHDGSANLRWFQFEVESKFISLDTNRFHSIEACCFCLYRVSSGWHLLKFIFAVLICSCFR